MRLRGCTKTGLPSVARPALLRHIGPQASSRKWPGLPKPLPMGEVSAQQTERASPFPKSICTAISIGFCQSDAIAVQELFGSGLALSVGLAPAKAGLRLPASASLPLASCWPRPQQLLPVSATGGGRRRCPQRGSHWHVGQLSSGRAKHDVPETVVLRCPGQQQLDKVRLSRSRCPL